MNLIELKIGGSLREAGVALPCVRKLYRHLEKELGAHPFCNREISLGVEPIFARGLDENESREVSKALADHHFFETIVLPFLHQIEYDQQRRLAIRWRIADLVVIDPAIRFGKPVVEQTGIATSILSRSCYANHQDVELVGRWFGVEPRHVRAAVSFENGVAA